jgi:hypothetical protein
VRLHVLFTRRIGCRARMLPAERRLRC